MTKYPSPEHEGADDFSDLRAAARALTGPPAPPALIARVAAERGRGLRTAIPGGEPALPHPPARRSVLVAAAAALVIGLVVLHRWPQPHEPAAGEAAQGACAMNPETRALMMASFLLATACAEEPVAAPYEPAPPVAELGAHGVRGGTWVYRIGRQGGRTSYQAVYELASTGSGEHAEWMSVNSRRTPDGWALADTAYYAADGLKPLRQTFHRAHDGQDRWAVRVTYGADSAHVVSDYLGYRDRPPQRRIWSVRLPGDATPIVPVVHEPALWLLLRRLPLATGWAGSFHYGPFGDRAFRETSLKVEGEDSVEVPAGVFDCWRLTMSDGISLGRVLWVSKGEQLLVRSVLGPQGHGLEWSLVSFTPARQ